MPDPMYRQIADQLRQQIETGEFAPGSQLPTETDLQGSFGASRNTIRDALKLLMTFGLIETRAGQGTFVVQKFEPFVTTLSGDWQTERGLGGGEGDAAFKEAEARMRTATVTMPRVEIQLARGALASRLQIEQGANVISRHQERYIDDQPWSLQTSFYPMDLALRGAQNLLLATDIGGGVIEYLGETLQLKQVGYRDRILVRPPNDNEARFFRLPADGRVSVVVLLRTGFAESANGPVPFRLTESVFAADRSQFVINAGEVSSSLADPADA